MLIPPRPFARRLVVIACATFFVTAVTKGRAEGSLPARAVVDAIIAPLLVEFSIPGVAVGLTIDGHQAFFCYGLASKEAGSPVSESTLFEVGSISKTFTATLGAYAVETGRLTLEDHPSRFMPELADKPIDRATILQLGTYAAGGLPLQFPDEVESSRQLVAYFQNWKPDFGPGEQRLYSNPSIGLFGHLAARALDKPFALAVEETLLPALGLHHTFLTIPKNAQSNYAWGLSADGKPTRVSPGLFDAEAYGIKTTVVDLLRYVELQIDASPLNKDWQGAVQRTHAGVYSVEGMVQCLGWERYPWPVTREHLLAGNSGKIILEANPTHALEAPSDAGESFLFNKTGSTRGFGAYVLFIPREKVGIVLLANKSYPIAARVKTAYAILEAATSKKKAP